MKTIKTFPLRSFFLCCAGSPNRKSQFPCFTSVFPDWSMASWESWNVVALKLSITPTASPDTRNILLLLSIQHFANHRDSKEKKKKKNAILKTFCFPPFPIFFSVSITNWFSRTRSVLAFSLVSGRLDALTLVFIFTSRITHGVFLALCNWSESVNNLLNN